MKKMLLVIRMRHGQFITVPMIEENALKLINLWTIGKLPTTDGGCLCGNCPEIGFWAVKADEINIMHTQDMNPMQAAQQPPWLGGSGLRN